MWMAREQTEERLQEPGAELGRVTLAGASAGVALAGERRNVTLCLPGGYHWTPRQGETVLVIKSGPEATPCVVGVPEETPAGPGEVWLSVAQGVGVRLTADGRIQLQGPVEVIGTLRVNGKEMVL